MSLLIHLHQKELPKTDISAIAPVATILSGINSAINIFKSIRSSNVSEVPIATFLQLGDQLIDAQMAILALQKEVLEKTEEIRKLTKTVTEKEKYSLVEIIPGSENFAYARNVTPVESHSGTPVVTEPFHYVCQRCFDKGIQSVPQKKFFRSTGRRAGVTPCLVCHECHASFRIR